MGPAGPVGRGCMGESGAAQGAQGDAGEGAAARSSLRRGLRASHWRWGHALPMVCLAGGKHHGPFGTKGFLAGVGADGQVAAGLALVHTDLGGDPLPQLGDVADDAD